MNQDEMEELLVFPFEVSRHEALFDRTPLFIASRYLECFDSEGRQVRRVPQFILEALAKRLLMVIDGDCHSLDEAFGGRVRRQRNQLAEIDRQTRVTWEVLQAFEETDGKTVSERGAGTPSEAAFALAAERLVISEENVRRIFRNAASNRDF